MRKIVLLVFVLAFCIAAVAGAQTFVGVMNGANEAPGPGDPDGFGLAGCRFEGTSVIFAMQVKNVGAPNASHIHRGVAGVAGPVVITLASAFPNNTATGTATASAALIDEIRRNPAGFYFNAHNAEFPGGAIRAQLSPGAFAVATGAQEVPGPGDADGAGMGVFTTSGGGTTLNYTAMVQNIVAPSASHIHRGPPTVAGPVVITLSQANTADIQAGLGFRTNIGCFNPNLVAAPATFTAHRASDGSVLGSVNVVIPALLQVQDPAFQLISTVAAGDQAQTDFYVTWTSTLPIYIYGAVVDNRTGDVVYVD